MHDTVERPELFALRFTSPLGTTSKRPAAESELSEARPFFRKGTGLDADTGFLFVHGFTITPACFYRYATELHARGHSVSVPLLPGHGGRPADLERVSRHDWLDSLVDSYDALAGVCKCVVVVGISVGAALAVRLSLQRRTDQLVLLAPLMYPIPLLRIGHYFLLPILRRLGVRFWMNVAGDVRKPDGYELGYGRTSIRGLEELYQCMRESSALLESVKTNTVILQGRKDREVPAYRAPEILERLGSERKELIWLERSGHEIPRDHDAAKVLTLLIGIGEDRSRRAGADVSAHPHGTDL